ncbi:hypothetical protein BCR32DRAFT_266814 [Anaeromyces robustus]|uniref:Mitochondrial carrier n=1 Tax=Anaeromyces robustus TaxID=1754192 RepID=A0A1Y1XD09_9FUNG|nr:hypothetical protein BCR32DRAFT_266814 [Anaeromyces robustus]|eukprot:ORX83660.1 hypothetical protein BCR32DRAFT_266814 [Anaeromyces robustus]
MGLQTWQYLLGISYANTNQNNSIYSSDYPYNQSISLSDSRQSLNSTATQNSLSEAQNEILSTIENHFKMLNDKLQKKEQMENYLGIIIGFTSLTSSFLISIPFSIIRNRGRAISLASVNDRELIKYFNSYSEFPEGRLIINCCIQSLVYQSSFTLTEDIINNVKDLVNKPKNKKKDEKNRKLKKNSTVKKDKPVLIKTIIIKSIGCIISYPMYKSYICYPINYPKRILQNYKDVFSSIKKSIVNNFIQDGFKSKTQGIINSKNGMNQTHSPFSSTSSSSSFPPYEHSYLERMPIIDTTRWYSKFFTTVFYWVSYDLVEMLIYKGITHFYFNNNDNNNKKGKEIQRKPMLTPDSHQNQNISDDTSNTNNNNSNSNSNHSSFPPSQNQNQEQTSNSNSNSNSSNSNKEQRQNSGRSPQHAKVMKVSTTMLKRVYIDVFCRLASSIITKVITYPIDTICIKLLTNGTEIKTNYRQPSSSNYHHSFQLSDSSYPLLNKDIHGFWSCCQTIYQTKGILGFYENFLYGMIPEILFNTVILEMTYYATNYLLKYVESKYEIIPKSKYKNKRKKSKK